MKLTVQQDQEHIIDKNHILMYVLKHVTINMSNLKMIMYAYKELNNVHR